MAPALRLQKPVTRLLNQINDAWKLVDQKFGEDDICTQARSVHAAHPGDFKDLTRLAVFLASVVGGQAALRHGNQGIDNGDLLGFPELAAGLGLLFKGATDVLEVVSASVPSLDRLGDTYSALGRKLSQLDKAFAAGVQRLPETLQPPADVVPLVALRDLNGVLHRLDTPTAGR